jgi:hypothetical protein
MGREIVNVSPNFEHPKASDGEFLPGAHYELLYSFPPEQLTHFQIYENVSEGTPVSPIFSSLQAIKTWLVTQGYSEGAAKQFIESGHAPMLVIKQKGNGT